MFNTAAMNLSRKTGPMQQRRSYGTSAAAKRERRRALQKNRSARRRQGTGDNNQEQHAGVVEANYASDGPCADLSLESGLDTTPHKNRSARCRQGTGDNNQEQHAGVVEANCASDGPYADLSLESGLDTTPKPCNFHCTPSSSRDGVGITHEEDPTVFEWNSDCEGLCQDKNEIPQTPRDDLLPPSKRTEGVKHADRSDGEVRSVLEKTVSSAKPPPAPLRGLSSARRKILADSTASRELSFPEKTTGREAMGEDENCAVHGPTHSQKRHDREGLQEKHRQGSVSVSTGAKRKSISTCTVSDKKGRKCEEQATGIKTNNTKTKKVSSFRCSKRQEKQRVVEEPSNYDCECFQEKDSEATLSVSAGVQQNPLGVCIVSDKNGGCVTITNRRKTKGGPGNHFKNAVSAFSCPLKKRAIQESSGHASIGERIPSQKNVECFERQGSRSMVVTPDRPKHGPPQTPSDKSRRPLRSISDACFAFAAYDAEESRSSARNCISDALSKATHERVVSGTCDVESVLLRVAPFMDKLQTHVSHLLTDDKAGNLSQDLVRSCNTLLRLQEEIQSEIHMWSSRRVKTEETIVAVVKTATEENCQA